MALRVWDIFLNEGDHVLFTISLALLQLCESHILAATDSGEVFNRLKDVGKSIMDPDILINKAFNTTGSVIKSYYYLQKRAYRNPKVQPTHIPDNLVGLGYAHLGNYKLIASVCSYYLILILILSFVAKFSYSKSYFLFQALNQVLHLHP